MNILIRKNFNAESGSRDRSHGKLGPRHRKSHGGVHGNRNRDSVFCNMDEHCCSYRTHLFLNTANPLQEYEEDTASNSAQKSSFPLLRWAMGSIKRKSSINKCDYLINQIGDASTSRKVSFQDQTELIESKDGSRRPTALEAIKKAEPVTLANLDRDCFIIPIASIDRFLPAGVPIPQITNKPSCLNVLEIDDPKISVVIHLMSQMEPIEPMLQSPLSLPLLKQKQLAMTLLSEMSATKMAFEGMLLSNLEKDSAFPYISYYVVNKIQSDPVDFFQTLRKTSWRKFDPQVLRYTIGQTFDMFNEVATIARPPLQPNSKKPRTNTTGYIVTIYKVFEGDDREKFEKNWLYWTGARMIYRYLPKSTGLRRITLHKSQLSGDKLYLLIAECSNFLLDFSAAAALIPALRARLCGYTGIYRSIAVF
ncbi:uncharacterized protein LOC135848669 isoform X2 [Planococcus citri]|uniref:uncharacterized protein LOC135848669 isoform X2 n=1 Tax=Planococcus citri TaxID=170843 RepID=UPI0031FA478C